MFNLYWAATTLLSISYYKGERVSICLTDPALTLVYHHYHIYTYYDIYDLNPSLFAYLRLTKLKKYIRQQKAFAAAQHGKATLDSVEHEVLKDDDRSESNAILGC